MNRTDAVPPISARDLAVTLGGRPVLSVPALDVREHEVLAVIGPNGSGKTTLVLALALLLKPEPGSRIAYWGQPARGGAAALRLRRRFAVLFQEPLLLAGTAWDNVTLGLRLRGVKQAERAARARLWLERFGVAHLAARQVKTLSGGEAKRVSLARAFVLQPEVLFLDEPFTALDSPTRAALLEDFESVLRETRVTTVMVTHERNEAIVLASRVAVLMGGRLRQIGPPAEVFAAPADEEVAAFIEAGNIIHGTVAAQSGGLATIQAGGATLEAVAALPAGANATLFLRHEDITLALPAPHETSSARNRLRGRIARVSPYESQMRVTVDCGLPLVALITRRSYEEMGLAPGREVVAVFKAGAVHVMG